MTTIQVSERSKNELRKIEGELKAKDGKDRTYEDIVKYLITLWKRQKKTPTP